MLIVMNERLEGRVWMFNGGNMTGMTTVKV
jgi:hypothetical protein